MDKIKKILEQIHPEYDFEGSDNFIEDGFLDSLDVVSLIGELESTFNITIDGMQIIPENFVSFESIQNLIGSLK